MIHHPNVAKKAQAEIDSVTGGNRLPDFDDRMLLPYTECIMKEVLRWDYFYSLIIFDADMRKIPSPGASW